MVYKNLYLSQESRNIDKKCHNVTTSVNKELKTLKSLKMYSNLLRAKCHFETYCCISNFSNLAQTFENKKFVSVSYKS